MEGLGWDGSLLVTNTPSLWSNQQHVEESLVLSSSNSSVLINPIQAFQEAQTSHVLASSDKVGVMFQPLTLVSDSMKFVSNTNLSDRQEALRLAAEAMLAKPGAGTSFGENLTSELCPSPLMINGRYITNPLSGFWADFYMSKQSQLLNGIQNGKECLLSDSNNTDTPVEHDGIPTMFSNCRNLWNLGSGSTAISLGESENNASNARNKDMHCSVNEHEERVSKRSSEFTGYHEDFRESKPVSTKRSSSDQRELKAGPNYHSSYLLQTDSATTKGGFKSISENPPKSKRSRSEKRPSISNINFQQSSSSVSSSIMEPDPEALAQMKEMIYRAAAFRPVVNLGLEAVEKPKRKNVRISTDPQTVAARQRRERISEKIRALQRLVPGGSKMDTASMLDEAANYLKFLRSQVKALESVGHQLDSINCPTTDLAFSFNPSFPN
ncbi:hypothetical protein I3843_02G121500 [Carya illinoinensis]|uniref:BHLH domain-containing protein n=1 Tax=Carya illinoinensis TaxID=32201 RepID=A0A922FSQ9_CARIL|nr:hypothetical protein I3842_Q066100 [Carya illinoinensis]KAG6727756.1 hypothetical protein I3842_02G140400 [Carya illinoinensis]KAG7992316.1 hypothetical protein I3843_02G121500 [Carya illinoinensis]